MRLFKFRTKANDALLERIYKLEARFEAVCVLLKIGFYGDLDYPNAGFINPKKDKGEQE